jgi:hypothetical protein
MDGWRPVVSGRYFSGSCRKRHTITNEHGHKHCGEGLLRYTIPRRARRSHCQRQPVSSSLAQGRTRPKQALDSIISLTEMKHIRKKWGIVMSDNIVLAADEIIEERPFTNPDHSLKDLEMMRHMAQQLVDTYDDPVLCDFVPGKNKICQSDPKGRHFRIYYIQPKLLFSLKALTVVGFFGNKRPNADIRPLIQADKKFEYEFKHHPGLLSLSTVHLLNGDFANLVLFTDPKAKDNWNYSPLHRELVPKISPPYYQSVRLNNAVLPAGLEAPSDLRLIRVKYLDYSTSPPWRVVREFG